MKQRSDILREVEVWFAKFTDWEARLVKAETAAWRFRVTNKPTGRETDVLVPFNPTYRHFRDIAKKLRLFFELYGGTK